MAKVTFKHLRALNYCVPRIRTWCKDYGFNIRDFGDGIDSEKIRTTGCGFGIRAAELAEQEEKENGR